MTEPFARRHAGAHRWGFRPNVIRQSEAIYDPATTRANPNGSGFVRDLFPGNVAPRNRQDPLALRVLEFMPLPNTPPLNAFRVNVLFPDGIKLESVEVGG